MTIAYRDLEIELSCCACGQREIRILESPFDRPREPFVINDEKGLRKLVDQYDSLLFQEGRSTDRRRLAEQIGARLFSALASGRVGRTLRDSLAALGATRGYENEGLRLRLSFGESRDYDPRIGELPWELLYDDENGRFLGSEPLTPVVRYLDLSRNIQPLEVEPPLRVLAVLASPSGQRTIDLRRQEAALRSAVDGKEALRLDLLEPPTLTALRERLNRGEEDGEPVHILHFLGHGGFTEGDRGALYFERGDGSEHKVPGPELGRQLSSFRHLRLVVLASCEGARILRRDGRHPFTGAASGLIAHGIPSVVAMQFGLSERAAAGFTAGFYAAVGADRSIEEALAEGRLRIASEDSDSCEWATPVLFLRAPDGQILKLRRPASSSEAACEEKATQEAGGESAGSSSEKRPGSPGAVHVGSMTTGRDSFVANRIGSVNRGSSGSKSER